VRSYGSLLQQVLSSFHEPREAGNDLEERGRGQGVSAKNQYNLDVVVGGRKCKTGVVVELKMKSCNSMCTACTPYRRAHPIRSLGLKISTDSKHTSD
jgi:hypothetical protein